MFPVDAKNQALLGLMNARDPYPGLGTLLNKTKNQLKAIYNFAVLGGAIGTVSLLDEQGNAAILPFNSVVTNVVAATVTAPVGTGATISLGMNSTVDLMAATAITSLTAGSFVAGIPVGTAATWVGPATGQAGKQVTASIATAALTAGLVEYFIEYVILT